MDVLRRLYSLKQRARRNLEYAKSKANENELKNLEEKVKALDFAFEASKEKLGSLKSGFWIPVCENNVHSYKCSMCSKVSALDEEVCPYCKSLMEN